MKLELTGRQFRYLLDLVYIGNWVLNSTRGDVRIEAYEGDKGTEINTKSNSVKGKYAENTIPQYAFFKNGNGSGAKKLQKVIYPKNTVAVGYKAFYACYNLTEVSFPASVKELAAEAFYNCKSLVSITVEGNAPIAKM